MKMLKTLKIEPQLMHGRALEIANDGKNTTLQFHDHSKAIVLLTNEELQNLSDFLFNIVTDQPEYMPPDAETRIDDLEKQVKRIGQNLELIIQALSSNGKLN